MASQWRASITLLDSLQLRTTLSFRYDASNATLPDEFSDANDALSALVTDLEAVCDATVHATRLTYLASGDDTVPADADITDVAFVTCYLTPEGVLSKYHTLRIPAPNSGIFGADGKTIDKSDANLIAYVANFLDGEFMVSDGEYIDDTIDDGIKGGSWASVKKGTKAVQSA